MIISAFDPNSKSSITNDKASASALIVLAVFILFGMIMIERFGRSSSSVTLGPRRRELYANDIALPLILGSSFGSHRSGSGFGGGDFGGFGGGMSGGGGAGGSW